MKKTRWLRLGLLAVVMVVGLVFGSCSNDGAIDPTGGNPGLVGTWVGNLHNNDKDKTVFTLDSSGNVTMTVHPLPDAILAGFYSATNSSITFSLNGNGSVKISAGYTLKNRTSLILSNAKIESGSGVTAAQVNGSYAFK